MLKSLLILLFITTTLYTQNLQQTIYGNVKNNNGEPLVGATITIDSNSRGTTTNIEGEYTFKKTNHGKHLIKASYIGFITKTKEITIAKNQKLNIDFTLEEKNESLDEINIIGKTKKTKKETKGFSVNVIETKEASVRNIQTNELLNTTAGVKIRQNGGLGSHTHYSLNGLSGNSISIFIDGIPISMYGSSFSLNSIPPAMIENIEVYKGVVPGHLADDALGGVINIVMKKGVKNNLNASVSYGSFNTFQASINGLYRAKKSGFTVKASGFYNYSDNDYKVWGGYVKHIEVDGNEVPITAKRFNDAYKSKGGMAQVGFTNVKWADQFLIGFNASDDYKEIQHGAFMTKHPYKGRFVESDALLKNLTYLKKDLITKGLDININALTGESNTFVSDTVSYAYTWLGVRQQRPVDFFSDPYGPSIDLIRTDRSQQAGGPTLFNINRKTSSIRTGISYKINKQHKVLLNHFYSGLDREDSDKILPLLENTFKQTSDLYKNIYSLSYELNAFSKKLKVNVFGKHYQQKVLNTSPEFNEDETEVIDVVYKADKNYNGYGGTLSYAITPNIILLSSTEKAIRMPNETEVFGDTGENVIANLTIKPEISYNYNLGFRLGKFSIKKHDITLSSSLFSRNIKDLIGLPSTDDDDQVVQYQNFENQATSKGIEAQLNYTYNNNFGFNFNITKLTLQTENNSRIVDIPNTPLFTMNGALRYSIKNFIQKKSHLNFFYSAHFTDEFSSRIQLFANNAGYEKFIIPTQFLQDVGCSYTFPKEKFVLSLDVKNIFNKRAFDNRSVQKPGRAFYLKLNYTINKL